MARKKIAYLRTGVDLSADDRVLVMTPVSYGIGYFHGYVIPAYLGGAATYMMRRFEAADALRLIEEEGITVLAGVPTQVIRMLDLVRERGDGPLGTKLFLVGGDHLDRAAAMEFEDRTGTFVVALYGLVDAQSSMHWLARFPPWTAQRTLHTQRTSVPSAAAFGAAGEYADDFEAAAKAYGSTCGSSGSS